MTPVTIVHVNARRLHYSLSIYLPLNMVQRRDTMLTCWGACYRTTYQLSHTSDTAIIR